MAGHWYHAHGENPWTREAKRRAARTVLENTGIPQQLHDHGDGEPCRTTCTVLERVELGAGEDLVEYDQGRTRSIVPR